MAPYLEDHPPARSQYRSPRREALSGVIVVHTAESVLDTVGPDTGAENVAGFISRRSDPGSYHDLVDSDSIVHVVNYDAEAYHDGTGSNRHSLGLSGALATHNWSTMSSTQRNRFVENYAQAAARMARHVHARTGVTVPARRITRTDSEARRPGFIPHGDRDPGRRTDPGSDFPWAAFLARFAQLMGGTPTDNEGFIMDAEVKAAFDKLENKLNEVHATALVGVDEGRSHYGSLRGWLYAIADAIAPLANTTIKKLRDVAYANDPTNKKK